MYDMQLAHAELLAALDVMEARAVVSIPAARLFPHDSERRDEVVRQGRDLFAQRGLLRRGRGDHDTLPAPLAALIATVAFPEIAILLIHNERGAGLRRCWFYQWDGHVYEHTMLEERHHFRELEDLAALTERMNVLCDLRVATSTNLRMELSQDAFYTVKGLATRRAHDEASELLRLAGITDTAAHSLLSVLEQPIAVDNVAFLRCAKETVIDGRNIALLHGEETTWLARQRIAGAPHLLIETTGAGAMKKQWLSCFAELARV